MAPSRNLSAPSSNTWTTMHYWLLPRGTSEYAGSNHHVYTALILEPNAGKTKISKTVKLYWVSEILNIFMNTC